MKIHVTRIHIAAMVISGLFVSLSILTDQRAMACGCQGPGSPRKELQRVDAVFSGEVSNVNREKIEFKVEKIWKGPRTKRISVKHGNEQSDCTYVFAVGKKYLVYAYGKKIYSTHVCTRTKELDKASYDLNELGEGKEP
jgi:hypothetical protein